MLRPNMEQCDLLKIATHLKSANEIERANISACTLHQSTLTIFYSAGMGSSFYKHYLEPSAGFSLVFFALVKIQVQKIIWGQINSKWNFSLQLKKNGHSKSET